MEFKIHFFKVGVGDCIIIQIKLENGSFKSIMIDCGVQTKEIEDYVINTLNGHIDYLFITHIDNDHINGICTLLTDHKEITIGKILFNCFQQIPVSTPETLTQEQKIRIENLHKHLPIKNISVERKIAAKEALLLSYTIRQQLPWDEVWEKKPICIDSFPFLDLGELGVVEFISPTLKELNELEVIFKSEFAKKFYKAYPSSDYSAKENLYELLIRLSDNMENSENLEYSISSIILNANTIINETLKGDTIDSSKTNRSSLAFIWSIDNKQILFMGDAAPDVMLCGINKYKEIHAISLTSALYFDVIKMSHHGSSHSISSSLMNTIDSPIYVFCGGSDKIFNINTLAKVINRPFLFEKITKRKLLFNTPNKLAKELKEQAENLNQSFPKFEVSFNTTIIL